MKTDISTIVYVCTVQMSKWALSGIIKEIIQTTYSRKCMFLKIFD